ncbi:unnamed protein product [Cylindrotheca closterium]|uniref:P-type ATPase A domain-containing protein n=1 Tax=Cylindrotheca closterium TaxID=2856 RepID=A0AAD2JLM1_9STRA|nr:unnamed protein product [Cylindrotheca closterium]
MPPEYLPSMLDIKLAHALAAQSKDMIPPIGLPATGALLGLVLSSLAFMATILLPRWFPQVQVASDFYESDNVSYEKGASVLIKIRNKGLQQGTFDPEADGKNLQICKLQESSQTIRKATRENLLGLGKSHPSLYFFEFAQSRYYFCPESMECSSGGPALHKAPIASLYELMKSGMSKKQRTVANERYGPYNEPKLSISTVQEALVARVSSPLVVIQSLGKLLACLEDGMRAVFQLLMELAQHAHNARQAVLSAKQLASDVKTSFRDTSLLKVQRLVRGAKKPWQKISANELLPGDVFLIPQDQNQTEFVMPVDALVLDGQCLANEAVLTGESVPQSKRAMDFDEELLQKEACLDLDEHKNSIVFAGTTMLHSGTAGSQKSFPRSKQKGVVLLALRTGIYSSQGQLLGALKGSANLGAISNPDSERDALRLVVGLSVFAVASCVSLFVQRENGKAVPAYRRVIQCTRIICASIPSDLPLSLARVAKASSQKLRQESDVVCSEPGALLTAANVDTIVFDKTGTLTADTQALSRLVPSTLGCESNTTSTFQKFALAGCHSLVNLPSGGSSDATETKLVGDPLDIAAFTFSEWQYNVFDGSYTTSSSALLSDFVQLWQIRSFPFDSTKRLSSALVLGRQVNGSCRLVFLIKGSPDSLIDLYAGRNNANFRNSYDSKLGNLGAQGCRSIAIGSFDLSENSHLRDRLFPNGISCDKASIEQAKSAGASLRRSDFESINPNGTLSSGLDFSGFACFDASIRPSSKRIIGELERGGIKSIMLTGDAIDSALSVGRTVGLIKEQRVAILETTTLKGTAKLRWRIVKQTNNVNGSSVEETQEKKVSLASVSRIFELNQKKKCAIAATGSALEQVFGDGSNEALELIAENLSCVSVIARATPGLKKSVILCLKKRCEKTVLMCGDGANDVAAMKAADVSVAMLNGFGSEGTNSDEDVDDKRRTQKLKSKNLGSNRKQRKVSRGVDSQNRMNEHIEKVRKEIDDRVAKRENKDYTIQDVKDIVSASLDAAKAEKDRAKRLRLGGGDAAKILASERNNQTLSGDESMELPSIKPGEASLVAPFSCLHPSIDGVDAILRAGVATAASALSSKKTIALYSLMSGYHLASLYKDGFRYGRNMWPIELYMLIALDEYGHRSSCTSRPRLPSSCTHRPPSSLFHPSAIFSTLAQAVSHLASMTVAVRFGRNLEGKGTQRLTSRIRQHGPSYPGKTGRLMDALVARDWSSEEVEDDEPKPRGLLARPPYHPNHESDVVFIFSLLQGAVISVVNHEGRPFHRRILESQQFCFCLLLNFLLVLGLALESLPSLNSMLEMRSIESLRDRFKLIGVGMLNALTCVGFQHLSEKLSHQDSWKCAPLATRGEQCAADIEERLLQEESKEGRNLVFMACVFGLYLVMDKIVTR